MKTINTIILLSLIVFASCATRGVEGYTYISNNEIIKETGLFTTKKEKLTIQFLGDGVAVFDGRHRVSYQQDGDKVTIYSDTGIMSLTVSGDKLLTVNPDEYFVRQ